MTEILEEWGVLENFMRWAVVSDGYSRGMGSSREFRALGDRALGDHQ